MILNLETEEFLETHKTAYGLRVVLHERHTRPFPTSEGFTAAAGEETNIGLRLVSPWRQMKRKRDREWIRSQGRVWACGKREREQGKRKCRANGWQTRERIKRKRIAQRIRFRKRERGRELCETNKWEEVREVTQKAIETDNMERGKERIRRNEER